MTYLKSYSLCMVGIPIQDCLSPKLVLFFILQLSSIQKGENVRIFGGDILGNWGVCVCSYVCVCRYVHTHASVF